MSIYSDEHECTEVYYVVVHIVVEECKLVYTST